MWTSPISTWCCHTTPPDSTTTRTTLPRKQRPHGKPPSAGTPAGPTSSQSSGSPKFGPSEQQQRIDRAHLTLHSVEESEPQARAAAADSIPACRPVSIDDAVQAALESSDSMSASVD